MCVHMFTESVDECVYMSAAIPCVLYIKETRVGVLMPASKWTSSVLQGCVQRHVCHHAGCACLPYSVFNKRVCVSYMYACGVCCAVLCVYTCTAWLFSYACQMAPSASHRLAAADQIYVLSFLGCDIMHMAFGGKRLWGAE